MPDYVKYAQQFLNANGFTLVEDGILGARTKAAAERFVKGKLAGKRAVVATVQTALNLRGANLVVDGISGPKTKRAFSTILTPSKPRESWYSEEQLRPLMREVSSRVGIPFEWMVQLLKLEAEKKRSKRGILYNAGENANRFKGLLQLSSEAWHQPNTKVKMPAYDVYWSDAKMNLLAGANYIEWAWRALRSELGPIPRTFELAYGAYNQGPAGFASYLQDAVVDGKQSPAAHDSHALAAMQYQRFKENTSLA